MNETTALDDARQFIGRYVDASDAQLDVMTLWAAGTHVMDAFVTYGKLLFTSAFPASGKTVALNVVRDLSRKGYNAGGTQYALKARLAEARGDITLARDEVSDIFGPAGLKQSSHPFATVLREGYKRGATDSWSVGRVAEEIPIFVPVALAGLRRAVPNDIHTRCVNVELVPGRPQSYYDVRDAERLAQVMNVSLRATVQQHQTAIAEFRARGLHPKIVNRANDIWEPLLAVAYAIGGRPWLERALAAFSELALSESDKPVLTPQQTVLRDMATALEILKTEQVFGSELREEVRRTGDSLYEGMSDRALSILMGDAMCLDTHIIEREGKRARGWHCQDIRAAWERRQPRAEVWQGNVDTSDPFDE